MNLAIPGALTAMPVIPAHPSQPDGRWLAEWNRRDFVELGAYDTAPGVARGVIRERLPPWGLADFTDVAQLVATELVTNSVGATRDFGWDGPVPPVRVWLLGSDASVAVLVWDGAACEPTPHVAADDDESGRGLGIVAALSERWGFYFPPSPFSGKVTWAFISCPLRNWRKENVMTAATRCSCGFESTEHEGVIDHLLEVFNPPDSTGNDGMIHEEGAPLTCSCGFTAVEADDLDAHFLAVFTPADSVAGDGEKHQPR